MRRHSKRRALCSKIVEIRCLVSCKIAIRYNTVLRLFLDGQNVALHHFLDAIKIAFVRSVFGVAQLAQGGHFIRNRRSHYEDGMLIQWFYASKY